MIQLLAFACMFVIGFMIVGRWLEGINGKHGFWDEFFTPLPLGIVGMIELVLLERWFI